MVRIKTNDAFKHGQTNVIPFLGEVTIDKDGFVEVETLELAQQVIDSEIGFYFPVGDEANTTTTTTETPVTTTTTTEESTTTTTTTAVVEEITTTTTTEVPTTTTTTTTVVEDITTTTTTSDEGISASEKSELLKSIDTLLMPALQSMAAPFPKNEWNTLTKPKLQEYLKKQLADA